MLIEHASLDERELAPGIFARLMHGDALTVMRVRLVAGARLPRHQHPHEQATTVLSGHLQLTIGDTVCELGPGTTAFIPGNTPHHAWAPVPTDAIDVFTPVREDYR
jgi:quercetin dioxygenase-like cupin family protein